MKITKIKRRWSEHNLVEMETDTPSKGGAKKGWIFPTKAGIRNLHSRLTSYVKSAKIICPMGGKIKIVYRVRGEKVFVIDEPRLPFFSMLMHKHGNQNSTVDEEYKCMRCGEEVPDAVKTLIMMEATLGLEEKK